MLIFKGRNRVTQKYKPGVHNGLDIVGDDCRDVFCPADGIVRSSTIITNKASVTWEWGNYVRVDDKDGNRMFFCHLDSRAVSVGQNVKVGDKLGVMGNTGYSSGAHTHFEVRRADGKTRLNPAEYLGITNAEGTYTAEKSGWEKRSGLWYWLENGIPAASKWVKDNGHRYYLGADGAMLTGMRKIDGKVYYLSRAQGIGSAAAVQRGQDGVVRDVSPGTAYEEANLYDQYMAAMEERYNNMLEDIRRQQDANISRIESQYGQAIAGLENQRPELLRRYEDTAKEAYLANMLAKRDLPQQLAAQGMTGGMAESAALALAADYQNQAGAARRDYDGYLTDLENQVNQARAAQAEAVANAGSSYDSLLADARNEYLANMAQYNLQKQIYADEQQQNRANLAWQKQQYEDEQALKNKQWEYQLSQDALNNQLAREQWEWQKAYNQQQADRDWDLNNQKLAASYSSGSGSSGYSWADLGDVGLYGDVGNSSGGNDQGWSYSNSGSTRKVPTSNIGNSQWDKGRTAQAKRPTQKNTYVSMK